MWETFFRRWIDTVFWWLPRQREEEPSEEQAAEMPTVTESAGGKEPGEAAAEQAVAAEEILEDDLTSIKGIGPAMQGNLRALGIATFSDLAAAAADDLVSKLKASQPMISKARVQSWIETAREKAGS